MSESTVYTACAILAIALAVYAFGDYVRKKKLKKMGYDVEPSPFIPYVVAGLIIVMAIIITHMLFFS